MPFGPWSNFQDCLDDQMKKKDKESAQKICGKLQSTLGGKTFKDKEILGVLSIDQCKNAARVAGVDNPDAVCSWLAYQGDRVSDLLRYSKSAVLTAAPSGVEDFVNILRVNLVKQLQGVSKTRTTAPLDPADLNKRTDKITTTPLENSNDDNDGEESTFEDYGMDLDSCISDQMGDGKSRDAAETFCDGLEKTYQQKFQSPVPGAIQRPSPLNASVKNAQGTTADDNDQEDIADKGIDEDKENENMMKDCVDKKMAGDDSMSQSDAEDECSDDIKQSQLRRAKRFQRLAATYSQMRVGSIVDKFKDTNSNRLFIKAFLLDASTNLNKWGITKDSIESKITSFLGKPLVLTSNYDHPVIHEHDINHAFAYQELFRIGNIISVEKQKDVKTGHDVYYAIIEITEPNAKDAFSIGNLPLYVSPAIAKLDPSDPEDQISTWTGVHLAIVDDPAYTVRKATITGQCGGDEHQCLMQLRKAHVEKNDGKENCGFCNKKILLARAIPFELPTGEQLTPEQARQLLEEKAGVRLVNVEIKDSQTIGTITDSIQPAANAVMTDNNRIIESSDIKEMTDAVSQTLTNKTIDAVSNVADPISSPIQSEGNLNSQSMSSSGNNTQTAVAPASGNAATTAPTTTTASNPTVVISQPPVQTPVAATVPVQQPVEQVAQQTQAATPAPATTVTYSSPQDPNNVYNAELTALKAQVNVLNQAVATWKQDAETWHGRAASLEDALRRSEIERIITPQDIPNAVEREAQIKTFLEAKVPATQVEIIYNNLKEISRKANGSVYTAHAPLVHQPNNNSTSGVVSIRTAKKEDTVSNDSNGDLGCYELASRIVRSGGAR